MDAQAEEQDAAVGQEMDHFGICRHGRDPDGSMDVVHAGTWDIVQKLVL